MLSMFASFLSARLLRGKFYVFVMTVLLVLISFFSAGVPHYEQVTAYSGFKEQSGIMFDDPFPLSFPLYAYLAIEDTRAYSLENYQFYFWTLLLYTHTLYGADGGEWLNTSWFDYMLFLSFFLLVNAGGAVVGYWLSRKTGFAKSSNKQEKSPTKLPKGRTNR